MSNETTIAIGGATYDAVDSEVGDCSMCDAHLDGVCTRVPACCPATGRSDGRSVVWRRRRAAEEGGAA